MESKIFYSWQSDLENKYNRSFIEDCIKSAIKSTNKAIQSKPPIILDQATRNTKGSPDISNTIFKKIEEAIFFVADVSIITKRNELESSSRLVPNPNVMIELGYAAGVLGWDKIILIYNTSSGAIIDLPFDIRGRRIISYSLSQNTLNEDKKIQKASLINPLRTTIYDIYNDLFLLENDPIVKIYAFLSNKIAESYLEWHSILGELYSYVGEHFSSETKLTKDKLEYICSKVNPLTSVVSAIDSSKPFKDWYQFISFKVEKIRNNIFNLLHFYDKLDFEIVGILTSLETLISGQILSIIGKDITIKNKDLSIISHTLYKLNDFLEEISTLFRQTYSEHGKEYNRQYRNKVQKKQ